MPLLTTRAGASAGAYGFGAVASGNSLELIASLTVSNTAITQYDFNFTGSNYKSFFISGSVRSGTTSSGRCEFYLKYNNNAATNPIYGMSTGKTNPFNTHWTFTDEIFPGQTESGSGTNKNSFSFLIGSVDRTSKVKPVMGIVNGLFAQDGAWFAPGHINVSSTGVVTGVALVAGAQGFAVGSRFKIYGIKAA